jgi:PEP-CTERM motif-containing protein
MCCALGFAGAGTHFARADTITFAPPHATIRLFGNGGHTSTVDLKLGSCSRTTCFLSGLANGPVPADKARYTFKTYGAIVLNPVGGLWVAKLKPGFSTFCDGRSCDLLSANLVEVELNPSTHALTFTLQAKSGSLFPLFAHSKGDMFTYSGRFASVNLSSVLGSRRLMTLYATGGSLKPVSEPSSMVLLGSGLISIACFMRRRVKDRKVLSSGGLSI